MSRGFVVRYAKALVRAVVPGYDVPAYASFLNSTFHAAEESRTHPASIAVYEIEETYPLQRHSDSKYISVTKNIALMVRSVSTV
jgi:primary-amine oxidase